ncbi:MAG: hypothetical protein R2867_24705 [Caldilineaceae bacterium]
MLPRNYDAALITLDIPGDPDQYWLWHSSQSEGSGFNYAGLEKRKEVDELLQQARSHYE